MLLICGMQLILLSAGTSYVRPGPAVGISCCGHGRGEKGSNGQYFSATTSKGCVARDKVLAAEV